MTLEFKSRWTDDLTPGSFKEELHLEALSADELISVLYDARQMQNFGKNLGEYVRDIINPKFKGQEEHETDIFDVKFDYQVRKGNMDVERLEDEMGIDWVDSHRVDGSEFTVIRIKLKEQQ
jgi:hypothetical protein